MIEKGTLPYSIIVILISAIVAWILIFINKKVFKKFHKKRAHLHLVFFERINSLIIIFICSIVGLSFLGGVDSLWKSVLGGTAVISAVIVFAAQDVIKDILAGLMISIYKPFEIDNRIELEDGRSGVVKDITMRHVVIHTWGSQELIIPNSRLNSMIVMNDSYHTGTRSFQATFHIAYGSDVKKAMQVIKQAVMDSPYTVAGRKTEQGRVYDNVFFMAYAESSLQMSTTVYYKKTPTEVVKSDVNLRVNEALKANGIEIPYTYINVIQK